MQVHRVGVGDEGGSCKPHLPDEGPGVGRPVKVVDVGFEGAVREGGRIRDVEVEALIPNRVNVLLLDGGSEFLAIETEFDIRTDRALTILADEVMSTEDFNPQFKIAHVDDSVVGGGR